jgi:predicted dienelactone hydrolase
MLPNYPLSNLAAPGGPRLNAVLEQPKDVSFVIDEMLAFNDEADNRFEGAIDAERVGATGHSLGAMTTFMSVYGPDRDDRIKAALPFAIPGCFFPESYVADVSVPILFTSGTNDLITPPVSSDHGYEIARVPRYLVTIEGADHTRFAEADVADSEVVGSGGLENIGQGDFLADATEVGRLLNGVLASCGLGAGPGSDPLLDARRQREILRVLEVVFFDAYLTGDADSLDLLEHLDELMPELSVQSDTDEG